MWHPDPDQLTLAALPAERRDAAVDAHLDACPLCRSHVGSLRRTVDLAVAAGGAPSDDDAPPDRVWRAITDELAVVPRTTGTGATVTETTVTETTATRTPGRPSRWRRAALPVAAALAGVAAGLGIAFALPSGAGSSTPVARLAPVGSVDPGGTGTVAAAGRQLVVHLDGVTDVEGADFLEAWLMDPAGSKLVALGSLARDGAGYQGTFTVPADLPTAEFDTVDISAEKWDGNPGHSRVSLLRGSLG